MIRLSRVFLSALPLIACIGGPALAEDYPPLVAKAVATVLERGEGTGRYGFTRTTREGEDSFVARFEPAPGEEGGAWILMEPTAEDALADALRDAFDDMVEEGESSDLSLVLGGLSEKREDGAPEQAGLAGLIGDDLHLAREDAETATFAFTPPNEGDLEGVARHLTGELTIDKDQALPLRLRYFSEQSFRAATIAHVKSADVSILFGEVSPGGPIAVTEMHTRLSGSALFRSFDQDSHVVHSDFTPAPALTQ